MHSGGTFLNKIVADSLTQTSPASFSWMMSTPVPQHLSTLEPPAVTSSNKQATNQDNLHMVEWNTSSSFHHPLSVGAGDSIIHYSSFGLLSCKFNFYFFSLHSWLPLQEFTRYPVTMALKSINFISTTKNCSQVPATFPCKYCISREKNECVFIICISLQKIKYIYIYL